MNEKSHSLEFCIPDIHILCLHAVIYILTFFVMCMHIIKVYPYIVNMSLLMSTCWTRKTVVTVLTKSAGLQDKTGKFSFCPGKTFSLSDKCPVNLSKENNILTTKIPTVLQILILSCKRFQSV